MLGQPPEPGGARGSILLIGQRHSPSIRPRPTTRRTPTRRPRRRSRARRDDGGLLRAAGASGSTRSLPGRSRSADVGSRRRDPATVAYATRRQPLADGFVAADDISGAAVFLLSDESRVITGQVLGVDAGWSVSDASGWAGPTVDG